jgi:hypothetical protein
VIKKTVRIWWIFPAFPEAENSGLASHAKMRLAVDLPAANCSGSSQSAYRSVLLDNSTTGARNVRKREFRPESKTILTNSGAIFRRDGEKKKRRGRIACENGTTPLPGALVSLSVLTYRRTWANST